MRRHFLLTLFVVAAFAATATAVWWKSTQRVAAPLPIHESPAPREERIPTLAMAARGREICIYPSTRSLPHSEVLTTSFRDGDRSTSTVTLLDIVLRNTSSEPWSVNGTDLVLEDVTADSKSRLPLERPAERKGGWGAPALVTVAPGGSIRWIRAVPIEARWRGDPSGASASRATWQLVGLETLPSDGEAESRSMSLVAAEAYQSSLEHWRTGSVGALDDVLVDHPLSKVGR